MKLRRVLVGASIGALLSLAVLELALHLVPQLVPASYRRTFPLHGVGFFQPDLLDATPIRSVPLPLLLESHAGPPPADLVEIGVAPASAAELDRERWGEVTLAMDARGLPNLAIPEQADLILVGDSFAVSAGLQEPRGLALQLGERTGRSVYNLGVAAIGVFQERMLLLEEGLPKDPELVVWMFFGGNDLMDTLTTLYHEREGRMTWGDVHADERPPRLRLPAILRHLRGRRVDRAALESLPGLRLRGQQTEVWLHPNYLRALVRSRASWEADPAFSAARETLADVHAATLESGAQFLFVYLPSKAQVLLPLLDAEDEELLAMATFGMQAPPDDAAALAAEARANVDALEQELEATCAALGIPFLSATPHLRAGAAAGSLGYLVADTHWDAVGHEQLLGPLVDAVHALLD